MPAPTQVHCQSAVVFDFRRLAPGSEGGLRQRGGVKQPGRKTTGMKRTLLEVFCGLAALVLMVSFHHQVARLEARQQDVTALERKVDRAVEVATSSGKTRDVEALRQVVQQTEQRMVQLEEQLRHAAAGSEQANQIAGELERAKYDVATFRNQLSTDFERTKALVDAFTDEVRAKEQDAALRLSQTQSSIATLASQLWRDPNELT